MRFCPSCDRHVFEGTFTCPFCQAPCGTVRGGSLAILGITLGVALTACGEPKPGGTADENTTVSTPSTNGNTTVDSDDPEDSFDAYGATYTVSGDSPSWSETRTTSTETDNHTATGTATDTDTDTGTDTGTTGTDTDTGTSSTTGTDTGTSTTTTTDTGTSTTTTTDTGSTGAASSTG